LNLPRPEDIEVLPALLDGEVEVGDWTGTVTAIAARPVAALVERAELLGLPLGGWPGPGGRDAGSPFRIDGREPGRTPHVGVGLAAAASTPALVVDLTSLWAGPLATSLLVARGTRVIKVEGARRPDGARRGPAAFFDLLNHGKESVALDFDRAEDVALLHRLVARADVVVEASRPRVMERLGLDPVAVVRTGTTTWISITGYGRTGAGANRVAFGDDAAFAAGCTVGDPPRLVADAVADPIAGLYGAAVALAALVGARGNVVDLALVDAAAYACGDAAQSRPADATVTVAPPTTRDPRSPAPAFGASTAVVRAEFGVASAR
ncbi:MAG TPA: CoA transferase, partial [Acidimicrobiales bacterium]|nr:CoA transferase [Acidimicrobiales bacterium]